MILEIFFLILGLIILIKSSDIVIEKSIELSQLTKLSKLAIGFIFLAVVTSLPEFAIMIISSFEGNGILGIATLLGANIADIVLIFGVMTLFGSFMIIGKDFDRIYHAILITSIIATFSLILGRVDITFGIFALFMFYLFSTYILKEGFPIGGKEKPKLVTVEVIKCILMILGGIALVIISAKIVTDSAIAIANFFNVYQSLIGATIIPIGTTLPELAVCVTALKKLNIELAVGNIIGSLVANLALILGFGAIISTIAFDPIIKISIIFLLITNAVFLIMAKRENFGLTQGMILLLIYLSYLALMFFIGVM